MFLFSSTCGGLAYPIYPPLHHPLTTYSLTPSSVAGKKDHVTVADVVKWDFVQALLAQQTTTEGAVQVGADVAPLESICLYVPSHREDTIINAGIV